MARYGCALLLAAALSACNGGSGGSSAGGDFHVEHVSVPSGGVWKLNRPIEVRFSAEVDFATVNANTIQIVAVSGTPATGTFTQPLLANGSVDRRRVRFQPTCPSRADGLDGGFAPGHTYSLQIVAGGVCVRSVANEPLGESRTVTFSTPTGSPSTLFFDPEPGPPSVRVRGAEGVAADDVAATYVEVGDDATQRVYLEWDATAQRAVLPVGMELPYNLYSAVETQVAFVLQFDQPVRPDPVNLGPSRLRLEYLRADTGNWERVPTRVELVENCTEAGAVVRLEPRGVLPQGSDLRIVLRAGLADLSGDAIFSDRTDWTRMPVGRADHPGTTDPGAEADEILESFLVGGGGPDSLEDVDAALSTPRADWGGGELRASFAFAGTGGPGGNFDWYLAGGTTTILNTSGATIVGGPGGAATTSQPVVGGVVNVRNLFVQSGAQLIVIGPRPLTFLVSGWARIDGEISVNGSRSTGVTTLGTTNIPEPGASGNGGGGSGGTGSYLTTQSTPRGGRGFGAFELPNGGGQGGETGYAPVNKDDRRGGGGGGGRFGPDVYHPYAGHSLRCQTLIGFDAEPGFGGGNDPGRGAVSQSERPQGGDIGTGPFLDDDPGNDFFGSMIVGPGGPDPQLVVGELDRLWAGPGGGAGGDAVDSTSFPLVPFLITGDEKGAGGGGGAGGIQILAIGPIEIGAEGRVSADGGSGGPGENGGGFDRVGAGSGGGAGGHVLLSSATRIVVAGAAPNAGDWYFDSDLGHRPRSLSALGGQGGAGRKDKGGATLEGSTLWRCDAIPLAFFEGTDVLPQGTPCWSAPYFALPDIFDALGPVLGCGGDGGPGLIQLHVDDPAVNLRFSALQDAGGLPAYGQGLDVTPACAPPPLGWNGPDEPADYLLPFFGRRSSAQSRWIPLGLARVDADGGTGPVSFRFDGTDASGRIVTSGTEVPALDPLLGPTPLGAATGPPPYVALGGTAVVFDAARFDPDDQLYLANPALLRRFLVELRGDQGERARFSVADAAFDGSLLTVWVSGGGLDAFHPPGGASVVLVPRYFRVFTNGQPDSMSAEGAVTVEFDATRAGADGEPSESVAHGFDPDVGILGSEAWDFVRFRVLFDLDTDPDSPVQLGTPRPGLDFFRIPFEF